MEYEIEDQHEVEDISSQPLVQDLINNCVGFDRGFIKVKPSGFMFMGETAKFLQRLKKFEVRDDDIWICTFPKCGTTWTQEMIWCLKNNLDFETSKNIDLDERMPFLEAIALTQESFGKVKDSIEQANIHPSPRIIKTHLPFNMLPDAIRTRKKNPKIIHVNRNSRDVCVSLFHHWKLLGGYSGSFELFAKLFLEGYSGYYSPYWKHVNTYIKSKYKNMIFLSYEDMKQDLASNIEKVAAFIECKEPLESEMALLKEHLSVKSFQTTPSLNKTVLIELMDKHGCSKPEEGIGFVRKGIVGDWINYFSKELSVAFLAKDGSIPKP